MVKTQEEVEKKLMRRENLLLRSILGLVRRSRESTAQQEAERMAEGQAAGSQQGIAEDDREVQSRSGTAHPQD